ncbi:MATE family efflux transporter [Rhodobacter sp. Har01]|uniref:MATE family efflux transporter n=1 Tax=Rhodobacter sp. Har01 TaxID=2883999 RepID=UPI001D05C28F|nr:MATE family efflux transporter [Rhodobacter sp. Har01]MCB6178736.1 MATE family efflux transporter [Rhodobacter sp. Har01]
MPLSAHASATLVLGLPLVGSSLAQMALHVADTVMMGWYGVAPLAALVLGSSSFFILYVFGSGFAKAVLPLVAQARATGDEAQVRRDARMGLWLSAGFGALIYPVFWYSGPILRTLHQTEEVAALAEAYLRIAGLGMVPALWIAVLQSWLAALGRTQAVLWVTLVALGLNVALNWALIFGNWGAPELGVRGAAIATVLVQIAAMVILAAYATWLPALRPYRLFRRFWRMDGPALRGVFRLGWPIGLTGIAEGGMFEASAIMMGWVGTVELAAHGIALEAAAVAFMVHVGLSSAATIRVAGFAGARDARALRDAAGVALALSLVVALAVTAAFVIWPEAIIGLFVDQAKPGSSGILAFGVVLLAVAALFQLADAMQVMALGLLRGVQDTRVPMALAAVSYWGIGIPASYVLAFPLGYGGVGLWFGLTLGLVAAGGSLMLRFWLLAPKPGVAPEPSL